MGLLPAVSPFISESKPWLVLPLKNYNGRWYLLLQVTKWRI